MTDYTKVEIGKPYKEGRIGKGMVCPICKERGLLLQEYIDPCSGSEKRRVCLHSDNVVRRDVVENGKAVILTDVIEIKHLIPDTWLDPDEESQP